MRIAPQRLDLLLVPQGPPAEGTPELFARMTESVCVMELVSRAPTVEALAQILRKVLNSAHRRAAADGSTGLVRNAPVVWVLAAGRPNKALRAFGARRMKGWPRGFYALAVPVPLRVVVIPELPARRDTIWLRLMAPRTFDGALAALGRLADNSIEYQRLRGPTHRFWADRRHPSPEELENMKSKQWYEAEVARLHAEGRAEGREEGLHLALLKQIELKFGQPSPTTRGRVERATESELERWIERILTAETLDELFES